MFLKHSTESVLYFSLSVEKRFHECSSDQDCLVLCVWQQSLILFVVYSSSVQVWLCSCLMSYCRRDMVLDLGKHGQFDLQNCIVENLYHFLKEVMCQKFVFHMVFIYLSSVFPSLLPPTSVRRSSGKLSVQQQ